MTMDAAAWEAGTPCEDDDLVWCARCKPQPFPPVVVVTRGYGQAFHATESCRWLRAGLRSVERRGGSPSDPERVCLAEARRLQKEPCLWCLPKR